ncbi:hypothetical protein LOD99_2672 [Oopsacas minuta]|uniref:Uncharacterized protein n=1 Tax=Oopsacas minuta TaxID=111878 RepID=A0AAV7K0P5_9METZ|nr:hypothetical protein LOD99_2672 [Oopsacas minuta]
MVESSTIDKSPGAAAEALEQRNALISRTGEMLLVSDSIFKHSQLLSTMNCVLESEREAIPLPNVSTSCLKRIIQFVECNPTLSLQNVASSQCCDYFHGISIEELRELMLAANYMDMPVLLLIVGRSIGEIFKDMPLENLAKRVGFKKPEDDVIKKEYLNDLIVHFVKEYGLCIPILDYAGVWNRISIQTDAAFQKGNCTDLYLSIYLPNEVVTRGPRALEISVDSHDQGWSSYPHQHNTREGSWTYGEVWVRDGKGEKLCSFEVYCNLHACHNWELQSKTFDRYHEIMSYIKPGVSIDLMLCARFPGWINNTRFAKMTLFFL